MANRRSRRHKTKKFYCPFCEQRLWRLGSSKYYLFYTNANEIRKHTGIVLKKAKLLATQNTTYLDTNRWIEAFCCNEHGMHWLLISSKDNSYEYRLAQERDWLQTNKTLNPRTSNPSVSEFTLRMSRKLH